MNTKRLWLCVCVAAVGLAAGRRAALAAAEPVTVERIVAVVNNEIILLSDAKERAAQVGQAIDDTGPPEVRRKAEQQLRQVVDRMVDDALVLQSATELKLSVENAEIDRAIEEVKKQNNIDTDQFASALAQQGYTMEAYRKDLRKQLLRLKVINTAVRSHITITDEDIRSFYNQTVRKAGGKRSVHARHVLVSLTPGASDAVVAERRKRAGLVVEEARAGRDFAQLARTFSDDAATRDSDGDLGWLGESDGLPPALAEVLFAMDQSEVRGPVRTDRGFEVLQVLEKKESSDVKPLAEVKDQIRSQLYSQQIEKATTTWLTELRRKAHIDVRL